MVQSGHFWQFRSINEESFTEELYAEVPELFSIAFHHGGHFQGAKRMYTQGLLTFIDCVDVDEFSTKFLDYALEELGYWAPEKWFCYFKENDKDLDTGLQLITDDVDQLKQITDYAKKHREIEVYVTRNDLSHFSNSDQTMPVRISKINTGSSSARRLFD